MGEPLSSRMKPTSEGVESSMFFLESRLSTMTLHIPEENKLVR